MSEQYLFVIVTILHMKTNVSSKYEIIQRKIRNSIYILLISIAVAIYIILFRRTGIGIPCLFRRITGFMCPGCGMTHAIAEISQGNLLGAYKQNALSITVFPMVCIYSLYRLIGEKIKSHEGFYAWEYIVLFFLMIVVLLYGVYRNIV